MKRRKFVRKSGYQVPDAIQKLMRARHPTVAILWEATAKRWCLVQTVRGISSLIRFLGTADKYEPPTISNTVYYLDSIHPSRFRSKFSKERFLSSLDRSKEMLEAQKRAQNQITEGSKDAYNAFTKRLVLTMR